MYNKKTNILTCSLRNIVFVAFFLASCKTETQRISEPYNILFIMSDDLNTTALSGYGHKMAQTPHLDKLSDEGTLFTQAHCQFPLCGPSRVSIMTGLRPDTTKVWIHETQFRKTIPSVLTIPQFFRDKGYFSARVGKIFHQGVPKDIGSDGLDDPLSWDERSNPSGFDKTVEDKVINYTPKHGLGLALAYYIDSLNQQKHTDELVADEVIRMMTEHKDEPFFIASGFYRPHTPYIAPQKYFDLYPIDNIVLPENPIDDLEDVPKIAVSSVISKYGGQEMSEQQKKEIIRAYFASVSFVDAQVGRLMDALDRLKLRDKTIVVFVSDHGYNLGEHFLWGKMNLFEESTRVPLIVSIPGVDQPKQLTFAELIDLYPTLADATGFTAPKYVHGESLLPALKKEVRNPKSQAITAVQRAGSNINEDSLNRGFELSGKSLRTADWRYTEWNKGEDGAELYDKNNDPGEFENLSQNSDYKVKITELKKSL